MGCRREWQLIVGPLDGITRGTMELPFMETGRTEEKTCRARQGADFLVLLSGDAFETRR